MYSLPPTFIVFTDYYHFCAKISQKLTAVGKGGKKKID